MESSLTKLRIEMAKKNINQKELSVMSGVREATVSQIMNSKSKGSLSTWKKLSNALGCRLSQLVEEE